jgi:hypothetical protein
MDNLIAGVVHGGKKGRSLIAMGSDKSRSYLGAEVMDAAG